MGDLSSQHDVQSVQCCFGDLPASVFSLLHTTAPLIKVAVKALSAPRAGAGSEVATKAAPKEHLDPKLRPEMWLGPEFPGWNQSQNSSPKTSQSRASSLW